MREIGGLTREPLALVILLLLVVLASDGIEPVDLVALLLSEQLDRARLLNGHEFDSSYSGEGPVSFSVNKVIRGWSEALQLMREGAKWELYLPPELAYGRRGPLAHQTVIYEVELLGVGEDSRATSSQTASNEKTK